jgi:ribosomal protein S18 acetylase RimI-like enzyme
MNTVGNSTGDAVAIRALAPDDVDLVVELSVRAWQPVFVSFRELLGPRLFERFYPDWTAEQAAAVRDAIGTNTTGVAVIDGTVVGFVNVIIKPHEASGEIYMVAVDPDHQRRGIASALTSWARCAAAARRWPPLRPAATLAMPRRGAPTRLPASRPGHT